MRVILNLLPPPSVAYKTPVFPQGAWLSVTTSEPQNTQFITVEFLEAANIEEIGQVDPEFNSDKQVLLLKIEREGIDLRGPATLKVNWSDASGQEYSQETSFEII